MFYGLFSNADNYSDYTMLTSRVNDEWLGGMELKGSAFEAIGHKSVKHNNMYFYLSKTTFFGLHRPSSGHYYTTIVHKWDPTVWITIALYFALFWRFCNSGLLTVCVDRNM
jgi:hypothetical protein